MNGADGRARKREMQASRARGERKRILGVSKGCCAALRGAALRGTDAAQRRAVGCARGPAGARRTFLKSSEHLNEAFTLTSLPWATMFLSWVDMIFLSTPE